MFGTVKCTMYVLLIDVYSFQGIHIIVCYCVQPLTIYSTLTLSGLLSKSTQKYPILSNWNLERGSAPSTVYCTALHLHRVLRESTDDNYMLGTNLKPGPFKAVDGFKVGWTIAKRARQQLCMHVYCSTHMYMYIYM